MLVLKDKFSFLSDFSDEFLRGRSIDEILRIESTSIRIRDAERSRETEDRLASNKANLLTKFYDVPAGKDNRCTVLHPARFLPGVACTAQQQYIAARQVIGLNSPPPLACYDMASVGMGGHVTQKGWLELGSVGSTKLKIGLFNINNVSKSVKPSDSEDQFEMKTISEFVLAMRTMRAAAQFAAPWNLSFLALENFFHNTEYCKEELKNDENPARTLSQFSNFILGENANKYRDGNGFLTTGELTTYWNSFIGARPQCRAATPSTPGTSRMAPPQAPPLRPQANRKRKFPFTDICGKFNTGNCVKPPGTCVNFRGQSLRHVCNWRDPAVQNALPCGQAHMRISNH